MSNEDNNDDDVQFFTVEALAKRWAVSPLWVRREIYAGHLKARKFGRCVRVPATEAQRFAESLPWL